MRKTALILIFIVTIIASITVSPALAFAVNEKEIAEGDINTLSTSGYSLQEGFDVLIAYHDYTLYSSGMYFAYEITFDRDFCATRAEESESDYKSELILALRLFFTIRNYATITEDTENAKLVASVKYDSKSDLYIANGIDGYMQGGSSPKESKNFFFNEYTSTINTVFSKVKIPGQTVYSLVELCKEFQIPSERILFNYTYGTPYKIIKSNADETKFLTSRNIYTHSYTMTMDTFDRQVILTQSSPNTTNWYILAIALALVVCIVPLLLVVLRKKEVKNG